VEEEDHHQQQYHHQYQHHHNLNHHQSMQMKQVSLQLSCQIREKERRKRREGHGTAEHPHVALPSPSTASVATELYLTKRILYSFTINADRTFIVVYCPKLCALACQNKSGSKRRRIEIECASNKVIEIEAVSEDECEEELGRVMEDVGDVHVGDLWTGDDMGMYGTDARDSGSMCGTINFFNIDGIDAAGHAVGEVVRNNKRTNCVISNIVDQQSDWVNVGSRAEQAFKQEYGSANNVCFSHIAGPGINPVGVYWT
jgi:hypothetical protein